MGRKILGVDPGTRTTGWGIIEAISNRYLLIAYGEIKTNPKLSAAKKYLQINEGIEELIKKHRPEALSVETQFVYKNVQSAMKLGMARGSILIAAAKYDVPTFEYAPAKAKLAVTGNGQASKTQVTHMIKVLLNLSQLPSSDDAADALALAIAHAHNSTIAR